MSGIVAGMLAVICYSLAYVLLHKGQVESDTDDNGLLAVIFVGALTLCAAEVLAIGLKLPVIRTDGFFTKSQLIGYGLAALSGVVGTLFGRLAVYGAIQRLGATRGIVIESSESLVTLVLAVVILGESLRMNDISGIVLLGLGIFLLVLERLVVQDRHSVHTGILLGLAGALLQGVGHFVRKLGMVHHIVPITAAAVDLVAALVLYITILAVVGRLRSYIRAYMQKINVYIVGAGIASAAGVLLFFTAVEMIPVWKVAMIVGVEPVMVAVFSKALFRDLERITFVTFLYSCLVALGIIVLQL